MPDVETLRMLERIVIACGGIYSIRVGYKLFSAAQSSTNYNSSLKSKTLGITISKVGPGVFFAIFGAYILSQDLISPVHTIVSNEELADTLLKQGELVDSLKKTIWNMPDGPDKIKLSQLINGISYNADTGRKALNFKQFGGASR